MVQAVTPGKTRLIQEMRREHAACVRDRDPRKFFRNVREGFERGHLSLADINMRVLFEQFVPSGSELLNAWMSNDASEMDYLTEADAVQTGDFRKILLHALSGETLRLFKLADLLQDRIARTIETNLDRERIAGITEIGDAAEEIGEAQPYPIAGVGSHWVDTPVTKKRGFIVPVTKEAIFFDRTAQVREHCSQVVKWLRINKEKRLIALLVGNVNSYRYMDKDYNTYQTGLAGDLYTNVVAGNPFVNWKSMNAVNITRSKLRDPSTNEPIDTSGAKMVLGAPELEADFARVFGATETRQTDGDTVTIGRNPASGHSWLTSPYIRDLQGNSDDWYAGDPHEALAYMQNWGITSDTAGSGSEDDFKRDIALQFKVSERGAGAVIQPRQLIKSTP